MMTAQTAFVFQQICTRINLEAGGGHGDMRHHQLLVSVMIYAPWLTTKALSHRSKTQQRRWINRGLHTNLAMGGPKEPDLPKELRLCNGWCVLLGL